MTEDVNKKTEDVNKKYNRIFLVMIYPLFLIGSVAAVLGASLSIRVGGAISLVISLLITVIVFGRDDN